MGLKVTLDLSAMRKHPLVWIGFVVEMLHSRCEGCIVKFDNGNLLELRKKLIPVIDDNTYCFELVYIADAPTIKCETGVERFIDDELHEAVYRFIRRCLSAEPYHCFSERYSEQDIFQHFMIEKTLRQCGLFPVS